MALGGHRMSNRLDAFDVRSYLRETGKNDAERAEEMVAIVGICFHDFSGREDKDSLSDL